VGRVSGDRHDSAVQGYNLSPSEHLGVGRELGDWYEPDVLPGSVLYFICLSGPGAGHIGLEHLSGHEHEPHVLRPKAV